MNEKVEMELKEVMNALAVSIDQFFNGEQIITNPEAKRKWGFVLMLYPLMGGLSTFISNAGVKHEQVIEMFRQHVAAFDREQSMTSKQDHEPFDPATNMTKINEVLHQYRDGNIDRDECRRRLIEECNVADYNLDPLLNAYGPKDEADDEG